MLISSLRAFIFALWLVAPAVGLAQTARELNERGLAKIAKGDLDGAITDYDRVVRLFPKFAAGFANRGLAKANKGDLDGAIVDYTRALKLEPKLALGYYNRGTARHQKGDPDGALADYNRAIELDPTFALSYNNRANARKDKNDLDGALTDYNRAIELDAKFPKSYRNRGHVRFLTRNWKDALTDYNKFLDLSETEQDYTRIFVWLIRAQLGETEAANRDLGAYLDKRGNAPPGDWISKISGHLLGKVPEEELFAAAKSPDAAKERGQLCEAWYYAGMKKLLDSDKAAAVDYLKKCLATERKTFVEYGFAKAELKFLGQ